MEHRGALRKTKAIDLGLDIKSSPAYDEFQSFVAQSHGKSGTEAAESMSIPMPLGREPRRRSKQRSYDAEISIPVPQAVSHRNRNRMMERSVTHDAAGKHSATERERERERETSRTDATETTGTPRKSLTRLKRAETQEAPDGRRETRSSSSSPRPTAKFSNPTQDVGPTEVLLPEPSSQASAGRRQYKTHRHLTVPGSDEPNVYYPGPGPGSNLPGAFSLHAALSAEQLLSPSHFNSSPSPSLSPSPSPKSSDVRRPGRGDLLVRNFATSSKGIINIGDSFRSEESSVSPTTSPAVSRRSSCYNGGPTSPVSPLRKAKQPSSESATSGTKSPTVYIVHVVGERAVGKSSLVRQFATSEYLGDSDPDLFDEEGDNPTRVTVQVDEHLATVLFFEIPDGNEEQAGEDVDAYVIVYAMDQLSSFQYAQQLLQDKLSKTNRTAPAFLVANKSDLVRTQVISSDDGKSLARHTQCAFTETSATLCHRLDELLVQIVQEASGRHQPGKSRDHASKIAKWLGKLGGKINPKLKKWQYSTASPKRSLDAEGD